MAVRSLSCDRRYLVTRQQYDVADVITTVHFARDNGSLLAVRGGGHNGPGLGSCDGGVVIDLSLMKGVRVDPATRLVRVGPGCTQGDMDHATHAFGLAVPAGIVSTTGVGGLTLGGGSDYLTRKYGLTIDNLVEADVVLADGRFVTASSNSRTKSPFQYHCILFGSSPSNRPCSAGKGIWLIQSRRGSGSSARTGTMAASPSACEPA